MNLVGGSLLAPAAAVAAAVVVRTEIDHTVACQVGHCSHLLGRIGIGNTLYVVVSIYSSNSRREDSFGRIREAVPLNKPKKITSHILHAPPLSRLQ